MIREYLIRLAICADQFWFKSVDDRWKLHKVHPWAKKVPDADGKLVDPIDYSYWRNRVMNLCSYEATHQQYGLGYKDFMNMDPATFEEIETRIYDYVKDQKERLDNLANNTSNASKGQNLLEGFSK